MDAPEPRPKPARWWIAVTILAGAIGALAAIAIGGRATYDVVFFRMELAAWPDTDGQTTLAYEHRKIFGDSQEITRLVGDADTHDAPLSFSATIVGWRRPPQGIRASTVAFLKSPRGFIEFVAEDGKAAVRAFRMRLVLLATTGALLAGLIVAAPGRRWRRVAGATVAGLLVFGAMGLFVRQSYDRGAFAAGCWRIEGKTGCVRFSNLPSPDS